MVKEEGDIPPFSYGIGGLSAGWGAAVLPPQESDLADWPISIQELNTYSEIVSIRFALFCLRRRFKLEFFPCYQQKPTRFGLVHQPNFYSIN
jgi:hypothetical protein